MILVMELVSNILLARGVKVDIYFTICSSYLHSATTWGSVDVELNMGNQIKILGKPITVLRFKILSNLMRWNIVFCTVERKKNKKGHCGLTQHPHPWCQDADSPEPAASIKPSEELHSWPHHVVLLSPGCVYFCPPLLPHSALVRWGPLF